tara:strand:+ start:251 stop:478 length:228 start_codon:yes stop_codon:yes gene_type:complete
MIQDIITKNKQILRENGDEFKLIFNVDIRKFLNPILGFDLVSFEKYLQVPDSPSIQDFIRENYGESAVQLVKNCL